MVSWTPGDMWGVASILRRLTWGSTWPPAETLANDMLIGWQNSLSSSLLQLSSKALPAPLTPSALCCGYAELSFDLLCSYLSPDLFHLLFSLPWTSLLLFAQLGPCHLSVVKGQFFGKVFFGFSPFPLFCILDLSPSLFPSHTLLFVIIFLICFYSVFPIWISASWGWDCLCRSHSFTSSTHYGAWYISS